MLQIRGTIRLLGQGMDERADASARLEAHIAAADVLQGLPAHEEPGTAVAHVGHRRAADEVVPGGHGQVVGAGDGDGEQVSGTYVRGEADDGGEHVTGLAVPADDGDEGRFGGGATADGTGA